MEANRSAAITPAANMPHRALAVASVIEMRRLPSSVSSITATGVI
jgi:hypothetical protein